MAESVTVRCPDCRREHAYAPPTYPCACGQPVTLPLLAGGVPVRVEHRTWASSWVAVRCRACGRSDEWPQPEFGCPCGTTVRVPTATPPPRPHTELGPLPSGDGLEAGPEPGSAVRQRPARTRPGRPPTRRPAFRPVTIRTAQDAKTAAAHYLRWLGFHDVRVAGNRPASGVDLRGPALVAHVDPTTTPTPLREIETLWLNGLNESATAACFSLAGYSHDARVRADELALPLFVLDLTGTPQAVNDAADDLIRTTA
ncbi:hypothetical protein E4198_02915 [Streptomyces sp. RKND-216]|uniref:hypothetical protein n=1 Tax=Streptomyces sp. RKND-216 TaxID=2562581 RepID=UPI00109DEFFC|nr:hypothetical protein [Streptomyces sp. RKND-216]THA23817.1 hypothetical protein E4198_02915 [Streptomyces sp. RKND-216]